MKKNALQYLLPMIAGITVFCTACGSGANSSDKEVPKNPSGDTSAEDADTESMTTAELVDAILRDPEMTVFSAYNDSMQALEMFRQTYNVYGELNNRDDVLEALADAYDEVKILTAEEMKENEEKGIDDSSEFFLGTNVEILIASELFEIPDDALTDSQRRFCDRIMERSRKVQEIRDQQGQQRILRVLYYARGSGMSGNDGKVGAYAFCAGSRIIILTAEYTISCIPVYTGTELELQVCITNEWQENKNKSKSAN